MLRYSRLDARIFTCGPDSQQLSCQFGAGLRQVLAVVEQEQQAPVLDEFHQGFEDRPPGLFLYAEHRGHRLRDEARIGDRRQFHEPHAVGIVVQHLCGHLQRQPALAEAADAQQRQAAAFRRAAS